MTDTIRDTAIEFDVLAIGNALVDVLAHADEPFLDGHGMVKGSMTLIDTVQAEALYGAMGPGVEVSGGSAANTTVGIASFGGRAAFIGRVRDDQLGQVFAHDIRAIGARFDTPPLNDGLATARSLINVTPDGHRTMSTFLGAATALGPEDVDEALIRDAAITYLEGYLFDAPAAREAFVKAAGIARAAGRKVAITLSDVFVAERWRAELIAFLPQVDIVFANQNEVRALFETEDHLAAAQALAERVEVAAVTMSEQGSLAIRGGERADAKAWPVVQVVDTTGAGDQYAAGFLLGLARGLPLKTCAELGSLAGSEVIQHYGPRPQKSLAAMARAEGLL